MNDPLLVAVCTLTISMVGMERWCSWRLDMARRHWCALLASLPVRPAEHNLRRLSWRRHEILAYLDPSGQTCAAALPTLSQAEQEACVRWLKAEAWLDDQSGEMAWRP